MKEKNKREITSALTMVTQIGLNMVFIIGICVFIGRFIDSKLGTTPLFLFVFIILGMITAFYNMYQTAMSAFKTSDMKKDADNYKKAIDNHKNIHDEHYDSKDKPENGDKDA